MEIEKLEIDKFVQRAQAMYKRLSNLYANINVAPVMPDVLPQALMELGSASQIVELASEELYQQNEQLLQTRSLLEAQCQRYQDLFQFAPDGYLVTDLQGNISEANYTVANLLNISSQYLQGKLMINLIALEDRQRFRKALTNLSQSQKITELAIRLQKRNGDFFDAALTATGVRYQHSSAIYVHWLIRDITGTERPELASLKNNSNLSENRPLQKYTKGEIISLHWQTIFYVCRGLVKLNTICETGEEVLLGLAGEGMVFGSSLTSQQIYQATALSDVELVSIYLTEITASPLLNQALLPKINQRFRQTESFLAITGRRRVEDRLYHLLQLLKQEIGETVLQGTRISTRLTHEELASACCTTRVTVTRLLCKLKKQGKISFDSKKYIIVKDVH